MADATVAQCLTSVVRATSVEMLRQLSFFIGIVLLGCSAPSGPYLTRFPVRNIEMMREIRLSPDSDTDAELRVRLVSVKEGGITTIELLDSGQRYTAKPGEFYVGAFGNIGLQLISASSEPAAAVLMRRSGETKQ